MEPMDTRRRIAEWGRAADVLERKRREALRDMTDEEARKAAEELLDLVGELPPKSGPSGLVDQQRLFRRVGR